MSTNKPSHVVCEPFDPRLSTKARQTAKEQHERKEREQRERENERKLSRLAKALKMLLSKERTHTLENTHATAADFEGQYSRQSPAEMKRLMELDRSRFEQGRDAQPAKPVLKLGTWTEQETSRLLQLPAELRCLILAPFVTSHATICVFHSRALSGFYNLALTCRQLCQDLTTLFYTRNRFRLCCPAATLVLLDTAKVQHLSVPVENWWIFAEHSDTRLIFPSLISVHVELEDVQSAPTTSKKVQSFYGKAYKDLYEDLFTHWSDLKITLMCRILYSPSIGDNRNTDDNKDFFTWNPTTMETSRHNSTQLGNNRSFAYHALFGRACDTNSSVILQYYKLAKCHMSLFETNVFWRRRAAEMSMISGARLSSMITSCIAHGGSYGHNDPLGDLLKDILREGNYVITFGPITNSGTHWTNMKFPTTIVKWYGTRWRDTRVSDGPVHKSKDCTKHSFYGHGEMLMGSLINLVEGGLDFTKGRSRAVDLRATIINSKGVFERDVTFTQKQPEEAETATNLAIKAPGRCVERNGVLCAEHVPEDFKNVNRTGYISLKLPALV